MSFFVVGIFVSHFNLFTKHYLELEKEYENEEPGPSLPPAQYGGEAGREVGDQTRPPRAHH